MRRPRLPNLKDRIRVQRRRELFNSVEDSAWDEGDTLQFDEGDDIEWDEEVIGDGAGNIEGDWISIGPAAPLRCEIEQLMRGGGEEVIAAKLRGVFLCNVTVRSSAFTRQITPDDRFIDLAADVALNIRHAPPPAREGFITFLCEAGVTT